MHCGRTRKNTLLCLLTIALVHALSATAAAQEWRLFGQLSVARHHHAAMAISSERILVIGGWGASTASSSGIPLSSCELIDLQGRTIQSAPSLNTARAEFIALQAPDSSIIVIGGITVSPYVVTGSVERYDRTNNSWTEIGQLQEPRYGVHAAFVDGSTIVIAGGKNGLSDYLNSVEIFDLETGQSRLLDNDLLNNLNGGVMVHPDDGVPLLIGGRTGGAGSLRDGRFYRFAGETWSPVANFWSDGQGAYQPAALTLWSGEAVVSGGSTSELGDIVFRNDVILIDKAESPASLPALPVERILHTMVQFTPQQFLITGGRDEAGVTLGSTDIYTKSGNDWTHGSGPQLGTPRRFGVGVSMPQRDANGAFVNGRALIIGGFRNQSNVASVEIIEETPTVTGPVIFNIVKNCTSLTFCVTDPADLIVLVENQRTGNINLGTDQIISTKITVSLSLIETREPNSFDVHIENSQGEFIDFSGTIDFSIDPLPQIVADAGGICAGDELELRVDGIFESYLWSTGETSSSITVSPPVSSVFTVELIDSNGCTAVTEPFALSVSEPPLPPNLKRDVSSFTLCEGQNDSLTLAVDPIYDSYTWFVDEQPVSNESSIVVKTMSSVYVVVSNSPGCFVSSDTVFVRVQNDIWAFPSLQDNQHFLDCAAATTALYCEEIPVVNISDFPVEINRWTLRAYNNPEFSFPLGQFDTDELKQVAPGATAFLTICYAPINLRPSSVDILVSDNDNCEIGDFQVVCSGIQVREFSGLSDCNVPVTATSGGGKPIGDFKLPPIGEAIISPNPVRRLAEFDIDVGKVMAGSHVPDALVTDPLGRSVLRVPPRRLIVDFSESAQNDATPLPHRRIANYSADLGSLPPGMYYLTVPGLGKAFLLAVER